MDTTKLGQAGLQGWRAKVADRAGETVEKRTPLSADQVRALLGAAFFALSLLYVAKTLRQATREARS